MVLSDDDRAWIVRLNNARIAVAFGAPTLSLALDAGPLAWAFTYASPFTAWDARVAVFFVLLLILVPAVGISVVIERLHRALLDRRGLDPAQYLPVWRDAWEQAGRRAARAMAQPGGPLAVGFVLTALFGSAALTTLWLYGQTEAADLLGALAVVPLPLAGLFVGLRALLRRADPPVPRLAVDGLVVRCPACEALRTFPPSPRDHKLACACGHRFLVPALPVALRGSVGLLGLAPWCAQSPLPVLLVVGRTAASLRALAAERDATVICARGAEAAWLRNRLDLPRGPALVRVEANQERARLIGAVAKTATTPPPAGPEVALADLAPRPAWRDSPRARAANTALFYPRLLLPILAAVAIKMAFEEGLSEAANLGVSLLLTAAIVGWVIAAHALRGPLTGEPRRGLAWYFGAPPAD